MLSYYFRYKGEVYETSLQVISDGRGRMHLNCVNSITGDFVTIPPNDVMDGKCKFYRTDKYTPTELLDEESK